MTEPVIDATYDEVDPSADLPPVVWVEVLSRHGDVLVRHRCTTAEIRIGRGYGNDVVLDDPYIAAEHLRITHDATGRLVAQDLGSANGTFLNHGKQRLGEIVLDGNRPIRIGHTHLRIRDAAHPVAAERAVLPQRRLLPIAAGIGVVIIGIELLTVWLNETAEPKPSRYLLTPLTVSLVLLVWTAIWCVLSRIFAGRAYVERNLLIALGGALAYSLWNEFVWLYSFAFSSRALVGSGATVFWLMLGAISVLHLRSISPAHGLVKAGAILLLVGLGIGLQTLTAQETPGGSPYQAAPRRLLPPAFRVTPLVERDAFAAELAKLKPKLDKERADEPGEPSDAEDEDS